MSHVNVIDIKLAKNTLYGHFKGFFYDTVCEIKIDFIICEPHCVKFFVNFLHGQAV